MSDIKKLTLEEARTQLKMNRSLIEMLKGNTPIETIALFGEHCVEPLERLVKELSKQKETPQQNHPDVALPIS